MSDDRARRRARLRRQPESARAERGVRLRAGILVGLLLAGLLVAGQLVHPHLRRSVAGVPSGQLPEVNLASSASVEWECPGPLPAGRSTQRSSVIVVNPAGRVAKADVQVSAVTTGSKTAGSTLPSWSVQIALAGHTERVVSLHTTGPQQDDAVSVLSTAGTVAVFESVSTTMAQSPSKHGTRLSTASPSAPEQSPCTGGATTGAYLAAGSTNGRSDVLVSLFDPTATQAVAAIAVATGSSVIAPPALQGLIIKPYSLQVFDLARWVVQQPTVAVAVTATVGRIAVGAAESVTSDTTATTSVAGEGLLIGVATPKDTWSMTPGTGRTVRTVSVRVFDPGTRPVSVSISSPVSGHPPTEISATVAAGEVREILLPLPLSAVSPGRTGSPPANEGPIVVRTAEGVGVVVARVTVQRVAARSETVSFAAATADPSAEWVLPVASGSVTTTVPPLGGGLLLSNPGPTALSVDVAEMTTGSASLRQLTTVAVPAGGTTEVSLHLPVSGPSFAGVILSASAPVLVEQDYYALGTVAHPVPVAPVPIVGIPVRS